MRLKYLHRIPEANIQAEIYHQLKLKNIKCILEYKIGNSKLDIVVIENHEIKCIIEVKSYSTPRLPNYNTKQMLKYKKLNLPIHICGRMVDVRYAVAFAEFNLKKLKNEQTFSIRKKLTSQGLS